MKFIKKPVVIEAVQLKIDNYIDDVFPFLVREEGGLTRATIHMLCDDGSVIIRTLEGEMTASIGDWIIRGVNGEHYPCKPDIFEKTYENVAVIGEYEKKIRDILSKIDSAPIFSAELSSPKLKINIFLDGSVTDDLGVPIKNITFINNNIPSSINQLVATSCVYQGKINAN